MSSSSATFDDLTADFAQRLLPPQDLLPHAPPTSLADNLAIAPWTAPDEDDQSVSPSPVPSIPASPPFSPCRLSAPAP